MRNKLLTTKTQYAIYIIVTIILCLYACCLIYPFIWTILNSFMSREEYFKKFGQAFPIPDHLIFDNYKQAFSYVLHIQDGKGVKYNFGLEDIIFNTIFICIIRSALSMTLPIISAYCLAHYKFVGKEFFFFYGIVFCSIPIFGGASWTFKWMYALNLYDTYIAVFYMSINTFGNFLFYYAFFKGISWNFAEAAFIDGATHFQVFLKIMLPQLLPVILVFFVNGFIGAWNDWMTNYLYLPSKPMVAYYIYKLNTYANIKSDWNVLFAAIVLNTIIPLSLFLIFSKKILSTVYTGGLKG